MEEIMRLDLLEPEVLAMVFEFVNDTSPHTTASITLTCKYFASVVKLIGQRHKTLYIKTDRVDDDQALPEIIQQWSRDDTLLVNIRTLTVEGYLPRFRELESALEHKTFWQPLVELISKISKLRLLTWNLSGIPITVLDALHTHQKFAKLRLFKYQPSVDARPSARDKALAKSPALTHLRTVLHYLTTRVHPNMQETSFRRIVKLAPLEYACIVNRVGDPAAGDPQRKNPFQTSKKPNNSIRVLTLDGYNMSRQTLEDWSSVLDLSRLENLKCSRGIPELSYFECANSLLPNLKHVSLNLRRLADGVFGFTDNVLIAAVQHYLSSCSALESLSLWSWTKVLRLEDILKRHGPTLRSLQLHEREMVDVEFERPLLSAKHLQSILDACPKLKDLTFDMERSSVELFTDGRDHNMKYFEALRSSRLDHLQIYFDQGLAYVYNEGNIPADLMEDDDMEDGDDRLEQPEFGDSSSQRDESQDHANMHQRVASDAENTKPDKQGHLTNFDDAQALSKSSETGMFGEDRRRRRRILRPSTEQNMRSYVEHIWKTVFSTSCSARKLDVKFGEWESIHNNQHELGFSWERQQREGTRFLMVRASERDDQKGQCTIKVKDLHDTALI